MTNKVLASGRDGYLGKFISTTMKEGHKIDDVTVGNPCVFTANIEMVYVIKPTADATE